MYVFLSYVHTDSDTVDNIRDLSAWFYFSRIIQTLLETFHTLEI